METSTPRTGRPAPAVITPFASGRHRRFREAAFGLFIHWGPYAVAGVEASWPVMLGPELQRRFVEALKRLGMTDVEMPVADIDRATYESLPARFHPRAFDAEQWAALARDAGQRYVVLTTKHHDGFAMFDTATTAYRITGPGSFGRDVTAELARASEAAGVGFGAYFSAPDIADPGYRDLTRPLPETFLGQPDRPEWTGFLDRMETQVRELCTGYGELFSWWWDLGFSDAWPVERFHAVVRDLQPGCLINDRLGGLAPGVDPALAADFWTPEQTVPRAVPRRSTLGTPTDPTLLFALIARDDWAEALEAIAPLVRARLEAPAEVGLPDPDDVLPWESCLTFGGQWAWSPHLRRFKTGAEIIVALVECASRGGNLLMNVGPRPDGTIQEEFTGALREVGRWLAVHGEAIYGTTFGPVQGEPGIRTTADPDTGTVFVHILEAPPDGLLRVPLAGRPVGARLLGDGPVEVTTADDGSLVVHLGRRELTRPVATVALDGVTPTDA